MTAFLGIHSLSKSFGHQILYKGIHFTVSEGDRIGLLGPNGSGKSTLLKILMGIEHPDSGSVTRKQGLRVSYVSQFPEFPPLPLEKLLLEELPSINETEKSTKARILLSKAKFTDFTQDASTLSGGWKKRLDIARALMHEPDLLLLDEPTNHLDLEGILWLENFLNREKISFITVSHDRYFLENIGNKIIELNPCYPKGILICEGNMSTYMEHKEAFLAAQTQQEKGLASVVRNETAWLKTSPKARTTKSRSRIQGAYEMIEELKDLKQRNKTIKFEMDFAASERETRKLLVTKNMAKSLGGKLLFEGVDLTLSPKDRLGIVGKNGTGKTTLLKILAKQLPLDKGTIKYADDLKLVYFDQHREHILPHISLKEALSPTSDYVHYHGQTIHVNGWAKKFLFSADRLMLPVKCLSGGERARIHLARLMLEPADILFLDEPTNDLDIPTLEVIEESLKEFKGAIVLITHDRCLMDRVCTQILGLGQQKEPRFFADYSQWELSNTNEEKKEEIILQKTPPKEPRKAINKLSYNEKKELDNMENNILFVEEEISQLEKILENPEVSTHSQKTLETYSLLDKAQKKLENLNNRWQELICKTGNSS